MLKTSELTILRRGETNGRFELPGKGAVIGITTRVGNLGNGASFLFEQARGRFKPGFDDQLFRSEIKDMLHMPLKLGHGKMRNARQVLQFERFRVVLLDVEN